MGRAIVKRLAAIPLLLLIVTMIVTALTAFIPGDPAVTIAGENASPETIESIRQELELDEPFLERYLDWLGDALHGDLGTSLYSDREVTDMVFSRLPVTASLTMGAILVAMLVGIPIGLLAGTRRGSLTDRFSTAFASLGVSIPSYWLGMLLILVFSVHWEIFPAIGYVPFGEDPQQWFMHLVLPSIALGLGAAAEIARQLRSAMADVLQTDYIRAARAKGMRGRSVVFHHALKNAAGPTITVLGLQIALLLGGAVVVERVFGIPGLGQLSVNAVVDRDIPVIQGVVVVSTILVVLASLAVDIVQAAINPRLRTV